MKHRPSNLELLITGERPPQGVDEHLLLATRGHVTRKHSHVFYLYGVLAGSIDTAREIGGYRGR